MSEKIIENADDEGLGKALNEINSNTHHPDLVAPTEQFIPRSMKDLDVVCKNVLMYGTELDANHPGFKDQIYRKRRKMFSDIALNYNHGETIPYIEYTAEEQDTWKRVYSALSKIYPTHACEQYRKNLGLMEEERILTGSQVPQLADVSEFLIKKTGFQLRPCAGYLNPRDFLSALAFRVFNCTQYIRHHSDPFYTPEPDLCHEMLGHMPMLADPSFAQFSQEFGLASLGASDDDIKKLASCYLYTVEFGLCREDDSIKAFGAGLLSSKIELEHALIAEEKIQTFEPLEASKQEFYVTSFQPTYFLSPSIDVAKEKMRDFIKKMKHEYDVEYDPKTLSLRLTQDKYQTHKEDIDISLETRSI